VFLEAGMMNRREMMAALAVVGALGVTVAEAQDEVSLSQSKVYEFDKLPVVPRDNGQKDQTVLQGVLATGEALEVHETTLPPGQMPHAPHRHRHSELMLVRDGLLEFNSDGKLETAGPGGVFFVASNVLHGVKCVGPVAANYYVIAIGRDRTVTPVSR
jgi:quercetin dioxygenase-like cupin family protein